MKANDFRPQQQRIEKTEEQIFNYIKEYIEKNNYSPSVRDIQRNCDLHSLSTIHKYLEKLKGRGLIDWAPATPRTIKIVNRGYVKKPTC
ncbi:transcriptional regulator [Heyndrickxia acidiproducens]|uniref:LexA family protein n=1 Tax=Heyndrickxia acidiproducens TaxID=1121084 RepID=UPI0012DBDA04|nr:transcriptional regulator [Heyndrickxia acidiproducens]